MFACDRCCLDLHYQIHPAAKHLAGFLPFSLKCSLLMTQPQSFATRAYTRTQYTQNTSSVFHWERKKSHVSRCLIVRIFLFFYWCIFSLISYLSSFFLLLFFPLSSLIQHIYNTWIDAGTRFYWFSTYYFICHENSHSVPTPHHSQHICKYVLEYLSIL